MSFIPRLAEAAGWVWSVSVVLHICTEATEATETLETMETTTEEVHQYRHQ